MPVGTGRWVRLLAACALVAIAVTATGGPAHAGVPVITIAGRGDGHGVGLAQDGALEMGRRGFGLGQILAQFYPGTALSTASGQVRVPILESPTGPGSATVTFPDGGEVVGTLTGTQSPGFPLAVTPGGSVVFTWDGARYTAARPDVSPPARPHPTTSTTTSTTTTTAPLLPFRLGPRAGAAAIAPAVSGAPLWAVPSGQGALTVPARGRSYRGVLEADATTGALRLVNQVDVETYLTGMGEVLNPSWPLVSLEAQEIAARTYAPRAMEVSGELCDDTRCQVYIGTAGEYPLAEQAVASTRGQVLTYDGTLADTVYSADAAGFSATPEEGFGTPGYPYLQALHYPSSDPRRWKLDVAARDISRLLGLPAPLTNLAVTQTGPSGRALYVTAVSGGQTKVLTGRAFAALLGLQSTLIDTVTESVAAKAPPPPTSDALEQLPPDAPALATAASPAVSSAADASGLTPVDAPLALDPGLNVPVARVSHHGLPIGPVAAAVLLVVVAGALCAMTVRSRRWLH